MDVTVVVGAKTYEMRVSHGESGLPLLRMTTNNMTVEAK
jgi:hypothetical protein